MLLSLRVNNRLLYTYYIICFQLPVANIVFIFIVIDTTCAVLLVVVLRDLLAS